MVDSRRRPTAEETERARSALNALIRALGLRAGSEGTPPERGALTRLATRIGVSSQRVRGAYAGSVPVSADTLARWAAAVRSE
jgi:hypothetical protein